MTFKSKKLLAGLGLCVASLMAASPANAWYTYTFYYANGSYAGAFAYCNNGMLMASDGVMTANYVYGDHTSEAPC